MCIKRLRKIKKCGRRALEKSHPNFRSLQRVKQNYSFSDKSGAGVIDLELSIQYHLHLVLHVCQRE